MRLRRKCYYSKRFVLIETWEGMQEKLILGLQSWLKRQKKIEKGLIGGVLNSVTGQYTPLLLLNSAPKRLESCSAIETSIKVKENIQQYC